MFAIHLPRAPRADRWGSALVTAALALLSAPSWAEAPPRPENANGLSGLWRSSSAALQTRGVVSLGTRLELFRASDLLADGEEHVRLDNAYRLSWAPLSFLESSLSWRVIYDRSEVGGQQLEMTSLGDIEIALKAGLSRGELAFGTQLLLRLPTGSGLGAGDLAATTVQLVGLLSWLPRALPLSAHLNLGFVFDGSDRLLDGRAGTVQERYGAQISGFNRLIARAGVGWVTPYVGPFIEWSYEPLVGAGAPGAADSPGVLSFGVQAWPTRSKSVQLAAGVDIGLLGVGDGASTREQIVRGALVQPRWQLLLSAAYRFSSAPAAQKREPACPSCEVRSAPASAPTASLVLAEIAGSVRDASSGQPLPAARVRIVGARASGFAVDAQGRYRSHRMQTGRYLLEASAAGYASRRLAVELARERGAAADFALAPVQRRGILRGTVRALVGGQPRGATLLIPEADTSVKADANSGEFSVELEPGRYTVVIASAGFRSRTTKVRIQAGETVILNVDLHR